jgi:hypothetical protein
MPYLHHKTSTTKESDFQKQSQYNGIFQLVDLKWNIHEESQNGVYVYTHVEGYG